MSTIPETASALQRVLGPIADELARETGFVQRESKVSRSRFAQTLILSWLSDPRASLTDMALIHRTKWQTRRSV